jgi:hypothetical protein
LFPHACLTEGLADEKLRRVSFVTTTAHDDDDDPDEYVMFEPTPHAQVSEEQEVSGDNDWFPEVDSLRSVGAEAEESLTQPSLRLHLDAIQRVQVTHISYGTCEIPVPLQEARDNQF